VGIATGYRGSNPSGTRFFAHFQTGPGAHPASCTMGTGSFPGVKRPGRGSDHPPPSSPEVTNEWAIPLLPLWAFSAYNTSQQDFVPRKVYCVSNVTFHAESKYAIKIFPSHTVFAQWHFLLLIFRNFSYFLVIFFT
jgi:hypothetical protein